MEQPNLAGVPGGPQHCPRTTQLAHHRNPAHRPDGARLGQRPRRQDDYAGPTPQDLRKLHVHDELRLCDALYTGSRVRAHWSNRSRRQSHEPAARRGLLLGDHLRAR